MILISINFFIGNLSYRKNYKHKLMRISLQSINQSLELQVNYVEHGQHMPGISVYAKSALSA